MITISFQDQLLHDTCIDLDRAERQYGRVEAQALVTLISDAQSIENAQQLLDLYGDEIEISNDDSLRLPIGADYRARLEAVGTRFKRSGEGRVLWESVTRLKLVDVSRVP